MATNGALTSRIAVVTGASAGIGEAVARLLASQGCRLVLNARREERLRALADDLNTAHGRDGKMAAVAAGDAADETVIARMLDTAKSAFGAEADCVVINAGRGLAGSVFTSDLAQWEDVIRTNLLGAARLMRAAAERMAPAAERESGGAGKPAPADTAGWKGRDIIVIGSTVGRHVSPFSSFYGATKFGVHGLAEGLRREVGPRGVRVTLIEPGVVRSEFQGVAGYEEASFGAFMDRIGPVLDPADVARLIPFIMSQPPHVHVNNLMVRPTRQEYP